MNGYYKPRVFVPETPVVGWRSLAELGEVMNTVHSGFPCAKCGRSGPMEVYAEAVRWRRCGHTRSLPPLRTSWNGRDA